MGVKSMLVQVITPLYLLNFSGNLYIYEKNYFLVNGTENKLYFLCFKVR